MGKKKLRTHELTKATPTTRLTPAQRPRRRRDKNAGGGAASAARTIKSVLLDRSHFSLAKYQFNGCIN
jgi:hypothetical protein